MVTPTQPGKFVDDNGTCDWIFDPHPKVESQTNESDSVKEVIFVKVEETTKGNVNSTNKTLTLWNKFINLLISFYHFIMENKVFSHQATPIETKSETKDQPQVATIAIVHAPKPTATAAPTRERIDPRVAAALDDLDISQTIGKDTIHGLSGINAEKLKKAWDENNLNPYSKNWTRVTRPKSNPSPAARERLGLDKEALAKATIEIEL